MGSELLQRQQLGLWLVDVWPLSRMPGIRTTSPFPAGDQSSGQSHLLQWESHTGHETKPGHEYRWEAAQGIWSEKNPFERGKAEGSSCVLSTPWRFSSLRNPTQEVPLSPGRGRREKVRCTTRTCEKDLRVLR